MKLLLDTHVLLWWLTSATQLSARAHSLISAQENVVFISAASIWEIRIKESLGKIDLPQGFEQTLNEEPFEKLSVTVRHAHLIGALPFLHKDPFDRILIVQAQLDDLVLITHDQIVTRYAVKTELV